MMVDMPALCTGLHTEHAAIEALLAAAEPQRFRADILAQSWEHRAAAHLPQT